MPPPIPHISHRFLLSRAQLETNVRLMCPVRTAVTRAFDAKLVVGGGLGGLGGRCCRNKMRAGNAGTAAGMGVCPICCTACMRPVARLCRTAPFSLRCHVPKLSGEHRGRTHRGPRGVVGGRATLPACKRAASAHAPPSAPTCEPARAQACLRACMRVNVLMCEAECCFFWICLYYAIFKPCNQGTIHTYHYIS